MSFPKIEGYVVTEKLGSGSYSTVYKAYTKVGARQVVAVKSIDKNNIKHSGSAVDNLISEIRMLKTLTHPHIVQMKHFLWDHKNIYIMMEYCCGGDLSKYIHRYGRVPERRMLYFLQQLVSALQFLREKGVTHMDLKPHNLLLHKASDGKYILKVADFGFAAYVSGAARHGVRGSPLYMAPEMFSAAAYDERVDLWSLGVIVYECVFGRAPLASATLRELADKLRAKLPIQIPAQPAISSGCRDLLTRLLRYEPAERISFSELFAHPYVDLEHAPTRDNFDKGVALMREAVALDARGQHAAAGARYGRALELLVPQALHEPDPDRKAALTAQLNRYMQRAEEVKAYLKYLRTGEPPAASAPPPPSPPPPHARRAAAGGHVRAAGGRMRAAGERVRAAGERVRAADGREAARRARAAPTVLAGRPRLCGRIARRRGQRRAGRRRVRHLLARAGTTDVAR